MLSLTCNYDMDEESDSAARDIDLKDPAARDELSDL